MRSYPPIADYGLIGDMHSCALVSKDGSVDWACLPSFDSPATFARILDWRKGGFFQVAPRDVSATSRRYLPDTNILETTFTTSTGTATLTDFMPIHPPSHSRIELGSGDHGAESQVVHRLKYPRSADLTPTITLSGEDIAEPFEIRFDEKIIRVLECTSGTVDFDVVCRPRFDYGTVVPRCTLDNGRRTHGLAHGGANALLVYCSCQLRIEDSGFVASGTLHAGEKVYAACASLAHFTSDFTASDAWVSPEAIEHALDRTNAFWQTWSSRAKVRGEYAADMLRSALALKALVYEPSGAILAAATTSLPEGLGGVRNWDYRFTIHREALAFQQPGQSALRGWIED